MRPYDDGKITCYAELSWQRSLKLLRRQTARQKVYVFLRILHAAEMCEQSFYNQSGLYFRIDSHLKSIKYQDQKINDTNIRNIYLNLPSDIFINNYLKSPKRFG